MDIKEKLIGDICYHLGTNAEDPDEHDYVKSLIVSAYADLRAKTGVPWLERTELENYPIALDVIQNKVYLKYYGNRGEMKNTSSLERYIASKTFSLQFSPEAVRIRSEQNGSQL